MSLCRDRRLPIIVPTPPARVDYQRLFLDHLDLVDQIVRTTGRRRRLAPHELDDLSSFVHLRLIEDDYAILRKFQGRSSYWTYLATVIERLSLDYCTELWGRWRPSTMAERLGPEAVLLERLVTRDGHSLEEALELARTNHGVPQSLTELRAIWARLPARARPTEVAEEGAADVPAEESAEAGVDDADRRADLERLERALTSALAACSDHERVLIALRFNEGLGIAELAELMGQSPATLHRRLSKVLRQLQVAIETAGVARGDVRALIGHASIVLSPFLRDELERLSGTVRLFKRDG